VGAILYISRKTENWESRNFGTPLTFGIGKKEVRVGEGDGEILTSQVGSGSARANKGFEAYVIT